MLRLPIVINILGILLVINGIAMFLCLPVAFYYGDDWQPLVISGIFNAIAGLLLRLGTLKYFTRDIRKKDGFLIVTLGWFVMSLSGTLPYMIGGTIPSFADAFFETTSGFTTTGATILIDIEALPRSILFWRSLTHWLGGMGIIVLTIAILPLLGIGGMQLFIAESSVPAPDKLHPRIKETAKRLWAVYVILTFAAFGFLMIGGMSVFDSINHAMSTLSTGGFSTKNASIAAYNSPFIHWVIIIFMFIAGINFTLIYLGFRGEFKRIFSNEEFRVYFIGVLALISLTSFTLYLYAGGPLEATIRDSAFQILAIVTTTGFITADYTQWGSFLLMLFFTLLFTGACTGSTSGGIKIMRHIILIKNSILELKRQIHPSGIIPVRYNNRAVSLTISYNITAFVLIYFLTFFISILIMSLFQLDFMTSIGSVAACLGNIGPGIGGVGPVDNYSAIPDGGKYYLSFLMLLGRLELFTILILISPYFWKHN